MGGVREGEGREGCFFSFRRYRNIQVEQVESPSPTPRSANHQSGWKGSQAGIDGRRWGLNFLAWETKFQSSDDSAKGISKGEKRLAGFKWRGRQKKKLTKPTRPPPPPSIVREHNHPTTPKLLPTRSSQTHIHSSHLKTHNNNSPSMATEGLKDVEVCISAPCFCISPPCDCAPLLPRTCDAFRSLSLSTSRRGNCGVVVVAR